MCGIAGIVTKAIVEPEMLRSMASVIAHRGPDGEGFWINASGKIGFAHRRLSIIDLSENGKQPMHYSEGRYTITFNGEIYNYIELREDLIKKGYAFQSHSDTEVILALYDLKKENCLQELDGMFAFAIWDEQEQRLFCARDRFGEKPFYYYQDADRLVFASEIKQFWTAGIEKKLRKDKLSTFVFEGEVMDDAHPEHTFYEGICSLKAAHYLVLEYGAGVVIKNYWNLDGVRSNLHISFDDAVQGLTSLFDRSVSRRLRSDVPLGSSLSGGLDSSCIVYSINRNFLKPGQKQYTFSARFENYAKDEGEYIDALLADLSGIHRSDVFLDVDAFEADIEAIAYHQDEPFQSASIFAQYKVMQLARKHGITVMLDGQGADELLGGYENLYIPYLQQSFYNAPSLYQREVKAYNLMHGAKYGELDFYKNDTLSLKLKRAAKRLLGKPQAVPGNYFSTVLKQYIGGRHLQQLLRYADRNAMAHSVETRLPYLSHELAEYVFALPDAFKMKDGWPKYILRKAFEHKVPDKIIWRRDKVGFETPESKFLSTDKALSQIRTSTEYLADMGVIGAEQFDPWRLYVIQHYINR